MDKKIRIGIDFNRSAYKNKPTDCGVLQNSIENEDFSIKQLRSLLVSGIVIRPAVLRHKEFSSQQLFVVDIDNSSDSDFRSVKDALRICEKNRICPFLITSSFSGNCYNQKAHYYFLSEVPITDIDERNNIQNQLNIKLNGDKSMIRPTQLCFTGKYSYGYAPFARIKLKEGVIESEYV